MYMYHGILSLVNIPKNSKVMMSISYMYMGIFWTNSVPYSDKFVLQREQFLWCKQNETINKTNIAS